MCLVESGGEAGVVSAPGREYDSLGRLRLAAYQWTVVITYHLSVHLSPPRLRLVTASDGGCTQPRLHPRLP